MEINDDYIINLLWPNKICLLNRCKNRITPEIENYLINRFKKSESIFESLYCIKYNIERDNIKCPICGKGDIKFRTTNGRSSRGIFINGCCPECIWKYRNLHSMKTSIEKYGTTHPTKNIDKKNNILEKRNKTCIEKYGTTNIQKVESIANKRKQTCLKKYGTEYAFQSEIVKEKIHNTCIEKYGCDWTFQSDIAKKHQQETLYKKYGVTNPFLIPSVVESIKERKNEIQKKRDNTKRLNKTFGTSIPENKSYMLLINKFGSDNVIRQYKSEVYPFFCDFYISSLDLYIECNYFWTHQGHFYDNNSQEDQLILLNLINKSKTHPFYLGAITTWTERDILKLNTAKKNNLNYLVVWSFKELQNWIDNEENYRRKI